MEEIVWSQKKTIHLIKDLEQYPCLWKLQCPDYKKRGLRMQALEALAKQYNANIVDIERKIQVIKSQYRRERRKMMDGSRSGGPVWFGYKYSLFLLQESNFPKSNGAKVKPLLVDEEQNSNAENPMHEDLITLVTTPSKSVQNIPKKQRSPKVEKIQTSCEPNLVSYKQTPFIALAWGERLGTLEPQQRLLAEKAINDVLFEASQCNLHLHSVKINDLSTIASPSEEHMYIEEDHENY